MPVTKFIQLTTKNGKRVYINPASIESMSPVTVSCSYAMSRNGLLDLTEVITVSGGEYMITESVEVILDMLNKVEPESYLGSNPHEILR